MPVLHEIERIEDVGRSLFTTPCRGCSKEITLYFNGGELDEKTCCGFVYELQHVQIDFVISTAAGKGYRCPQHS